MAVAKKETTLIEALIKARSEMPTLVFDAANGHFKSKYLTLQGVMEGVAPVLAANGLIVIHTMSRAEDGSSWMRTSLIHTSGDRIESELPLPSNVNPQQLGSAITYFRRYSVLGILGMVGDEDDDGNAASGISSAPKGPSEAQNKLIKTLLKSVRGATSKADGDAVVNELVGKTLDNLTIKDATTLIDALKDEQKSKGGAFN